MLDSSQDSWTCWQPHPHLTLRPRTAASQSPALRAQPLDPLRPHGPDSGRWAPIYPSAAGQAEESLAVSIPGGSQACRTHRGYSPTWGAGARWLRMPSAGSYAGPWDRGDQREPGMWWISGKCWHSCTSPVRQRGRSRSQSVLLFKRLLV